MLDKDGLTAEVSVGVTYSALMSAVSLFFTGVLISQYNDFDQTIKVPLIFLIISTFSFIFSATVYTNAGTEITLNKLRIVEKYMVYGKNLMELLGLYPFILATPMVIGAITRDSFLRTATILVAIVGFSLYSRSKFSVLDKELRRSEKKTATTLIVVLSLLLYYFQTASHGSALAIYSFLSVILMSFIIGLAYQFSVNSKQYKPIYFRDFSDGDAGKLADIVRANLSRGKAKKLAAHVAQEVTERFSQANLEKQATEAQIFVAEFNDRVAGFAVLNGNTIQGIFTDPDLQRKNIGRLLMTHVEGIVAGNGDKQIMAIASLLDRGFYERLGYHGDKQHGEHVMIKTVR